HARVLLRVVGRGNRDPPVEAELADGEVDHLGSDQTELDDVGAAVRRALDHRLRDRRRGETHVPADRDPPRLELLDVRAPDAVSAVLVDLGRIDAAHVVGLEHLGVEHGPDATDGGPERAETAVLTRSYTYVVERKLATVLFVDLVDSTG